MNISVMAVRIFITKQTAVTDAIGNHRNIWEEYYTCYASVSAESPKEMTEAGVVVDDSVLDFTIRWCKKAAAINSTNFRVQMNDELYDITGVDHMNYKKKCIKLHCRKVRR
ncbi:MAG: phage head closure protein [Eubacteriales bacterium]|nr:phage head closure protein [Eubacteriales bacterium]